MNWVIRTNSTIKYPFKALYFLVDFTFLSDHVSKKIDITNVYIITITHCTTSGTNFVAQGSSKLGYAFQPKYFLEYGLQDCTCDAEYTN